MTTVTLKNVPENLLAELRAMAAEERRSLNQQILHLLGTVLNADTNARKLKAAGELQVAAWKSLAGRWESGESAQEEIAKIYGARTEGRTVQL